MEVAAKLWCEVLLQVVVLVDVDGVKSIGAQTNHNALCGETRGFIGRAGVGDHNDPIGAYHTSVVDADWCFPWRDFASEALDDGVDHDQVFDLWSCQFGL